MSPDVIVIGGGVSGLAAAVRLAGSGARVALLEQSPKLGGRCYSFRDEATGDIVDNGQHVLVGAYTHTLAYLEAIGTRKFLKAQESILFVHPTDGRAALRSGTLPAPFHLASGLLTFSLLPLADRLRCLRAGLFLRSWSSGKERQLGAESVDGWLRRLGQSARSREVLWDPLCVSIMNEQPARASALLFARALRAAFLASRDDAAVLIPTIGQTELYVEPAVRYLASHGAHVRPGPEVGSVTEDGGRVTGVRLADGSVLSAPAVIAAVPPHSLGKIVPEGCAGATPFSGLGAFAFSPIISIHLWFDREVMDADFAAIVGKELQWVFNRRRLTGAGSTAGYLSGVISGAYASVDRTKEELVARAVRDIASVFPACAGARLLSSMVIKEKRATFSATSAAEGLRPSAETPIDGFFLAGDWTNTGLPATIEGAIRSGETAAARVRL